MTLFCTYQVLFQGCSLLIMYLAKTLTTKFANRGKGNCKVCSIRKRYIGERRATKFYCPGGSSSDKARQKYIANSLCYAEHTCAIKAGRTIKTTRSPAIKYGTLGVKMEPNDLIHANREAGGSTDTKDEDANETTARDGRNPAEAVALEAEAEREIEDEEDQ
ncbi:Hypothetical protein PHPALM_6177 [Phytophthora palmivora]|uniref:Uncharacterized protein n=1 Tax=Phytophthora palmivora TaxID=4796 RepID=A0A2P4YFJ3_9STRA|nr:Hypothetical protein PHPALM_6177 [Phytophthora palmivora]